MLTILTAYLLRGSVGTTSRHLQPAPPELHAGTVVATGVGFGLAAGAQHVCCANGVQTAQVGMMVTYAHTFVAGSGGSVTFTLASSSTDHPAWSAVLYRDKSCNAGLRGRRRTAGRRLRSPSRRPAGPPAGSREFVPAASAWRAEGPHRHFCTSTYTNASPALSSTLTVSDTTTAGEPTALSLKKQVTNVTKSGTIATSISASPGDVLLYTLTAQNNGSGSITTLVINDATPAYTTFVSAACPGSLPTGITSCNLSQPASGQPGAVQWPAGGLVAGAQMVVIDQVKPTQQARCRSALPVRRLAEAGAPRPGTHCTTR